MSRQFFVFLPAVRQGTIDLCQLNLSHCWQLCPKLQNVNSKAEGRKLGGEDIENLTAQLVSLKHANQILVALETDHGNRLLGVMLQSVISLRKSRGAKIVKICEDNESA